PVVPWLANVMITCPRSSSVCGGKSKDSSNDSACLHRSDRQRSRATIEVGVLPRYVEALPRNRVVDGLIEPCVVERIERSALRRVGGDDGERRAAGLRETVRDDLPIAIAFAADDRCLGAVAATVATGGTRRDAHHHETRITRIDGE